jgi:hypothetical protein
MSANMSDVSDANYEASSDGVVAANEVDIAVAAWHEEGRWNLALLPDAHDLPRCNLRT